LHVAFGRARRERAARVKSARRRRKNVGNYDTLAAPIREAYRRDASLRITAF
jgi:hypothetical protein